MAYVMLNFIKRVETHWPTLRFSSYSMPITCPRMFRFGRMADVREPPQSAFWPTLTYFCDCDTQLYDRSNTIHISKPVSTTAKSRSKWLNLIFSYLFWHA